MFNIWPYKNIFTSKFFFFATPPIKYKLGQQIGWGVPITSHIDQLLQLVWTWCIMHPSSNNCHKKQNPSKKNKGPGSLTDTENKTQ
jgi:hypothetical protein